MTDEEILQAEEELSRKESKKTKPVYLFDRSGRILRLFKTTQECADYFGKEREYINHSLKYNDKIRKDDKWFIIRRKK